MADPACPRMTLFRFTDAALGQRFGAGAPVLAGIAGGAAGKTGDFPRALLPGGQELLVGRREVADVTSLILGRSNDESNRESSNGTGSSSGKSSASSAGWKCGAGASDARNVIKGFGRETIVFRSYGCVLAAGTKVMTAAHGSGKVAGFRAEDVSYEVMLDAPGTGKPSTVYVVPQNMTEEVS